MRGWLVLTVIATFASAPGLRAQGAPPPSAAPSSPTTPRVATDSAAARRRNRAAQAQRVAAQQKQVHALIDTSRYRPAPNAGAGIGLSHGAVTPSVGMTGNNAGANNSNGRTATPSQGSQPSPVP